MPEELELSDYSSHLESRLEFQTPDSRGSQGRQSSTSSANPTATQVLAPACLPWTHLKDCILLAIPEEKTPCSEFQFTLTELTKIHCVNTKTPTVYQKIFLRIRILKKQMKLLMSARTQSKKTCVSFIINKPDKYI